METTVCKLISTFETRFLNGSIDHNEGQLEALDLDLECIEKRLRVCEESTQQALWWLSLEFKERNSFEVNLESVKEHVDRAKVLQEAYLLLNGYRKGLEKAIAEGQQTVLSQQVEAAALN